MNVWKRLIVFGASLSLVGVGVQPALAETVEPDCERFTVEVVSLESPNGAALLTQFPSEVESAAAYGFVASSSASFKASYGSGVAVWRMYNSKTNDFTWAAEGDDLQTVTEAGYVKQFRQFVGSATNNGCLSSAHRLQKGDNSRVVVGPVERDGLVQAGWQVTASGMFYVVAGVRESPSEGGTEVNTGDLSFTIAVIPDTQQETWSDSDSRFKNRSDWLVANADQENLKFVTHVGDVVDWGSVSPAQYTRAKNGLSPLAGEVPYSLTVGNHDTAAVCQGGAACPGGSASVEVRDTTAFNKAFGGDNFTNLRGQFEPGKVDNSYSTFEGGGQKWMMLNLELWPRQVAIDWAKTVVSSHPDHNVVVSTHAYLNSDGSIGRSNGGYGATSPEHLFDTLVSVYPNIKMVVSGHVGQSASRVDTGVNGNKILSLLQCFHSRTTNPVRMLKVDPSQGSVTHWVYAPFTDEEVAKRVVAAGFDFVG
ncbi:MAG: metallophosphoesterase [Arachnia sp.]